MKSNGFRLPTYMCLAWITVLASCGKPTPDTSTSSDAETRDSVSQVITEVLTAEQQAKLTPDDVIRLLQEGNIRFTKNDLTARNHNEQVRKASEGQYPKAIILSCVDSRVPVEDVFDRGIGDVFVARVAGNFVNEDILGSMEYACKVAGAKLIVVMGHEHCGAVKAAIDHVEMGNITAMLSKIEPAVRQAAGDKTGKLSSKDPELVHAVCEANIDNTIQTIRSQSVILKEMEDAGAIRIVGGIYDMDDGSVQFLHPEELPGGMNQ
ncbi:MAG: carbonic anhydrase [Flavobacteriales bacterium]|nr:carbonic anhydrase [Flavobacteriales bacterium]